MLNPAAKVKLAKIAQQTRRYILEMIHHAGGGHPAGALGMTEIFTTLYFTDVLNHRPTEPDWSDRDRVILSNGHICPVLYATLAQAGYFPVDELMTFRVFGSRLQGHPHLGSLPGIENTSGPLGQGLSQAVGLALGLKMDGLSNHVFAVLSDGEHQEGQTWEAYMFAAKNQLSNLTIMIDNNNIQIGGFTSAIMPIDPLKHKLASFGWSVAEINGHDHTQIYQSLSNAKDQTEPTVIIAHTTPGKGVSFMENNPYWHGKAPSDIEYHQAIAELNHE